VITQAGGIRLAAISDSSGLEDEALTQEILLLTDVVVAVSEASPPLSDEQVDVILGVSHGPGEPTGEAVHTSHARSA